ncbi:hypothetical protein H2202_011006 [Exophiala xenobiotica]|nr:hypothetical protein H2202_011006 [Exophiala xenobiotica]KAK5215560.1 hypothetical protein LTR72_011391 [Exophiala xenobiotica]KAK5219805.1 hypothetical protein LTR47_011392 [Exophiala xenobiotica]KAK5244082.1 hypothetical protein LTS06_010284 [Exophiala xenobiotica]KAK5283074.1 hypothetical protein LTR40_002351 [Exophiala xenobiotica]
MEMTNTADPAQAWSVTPSVEDWGSSYSCHTRTPAVNGRWSPYSTAPTPVPRWSSRSLSVLSQETHPQRLGFVPFEEWDRDATYDEIPPCCLHYSIEWKVMIKKKAIITDTEQDVVVSPAIYWEKCLQSRLEERLSKKGYPPRSVRVEETEVIVSVTGRTGRPLTRQFDDLRVEWSVVERQLTDWSELFQKGKKLFVKIRIRYVEVNALVSTNGPATKTTKVRGTATQCMLADRAAQIDAEEATTGNPSAWRYVYALMRCPGPPCVKHSWCWHDTQTQKGYTLKGHHLRTLVRYVEDKNCLKSHDDIPDSLRQLIYAEEEQYMRRKRVDRGSVSFDRTPIQITNVLPPQSSTESETMQRPETKRLDIAGLHDVNVQKYCDWLKSRMQEESRKKEYQKAADFLLKKSFDLDLVYEDQNPTFLIEQGGVEEGIARRFVKDIPLWVKRCNRNKTDVDSILEF